MALGMNPYRKRKYEEAFLLPNLYETINLVHCTLLEATISMLAQADPNSCSWSFAREHVIIVCDLVQY